MTRADRGHKFSLNDQEAPASRRGWEDQPSATVQVRAGNVASGEREMVALFLPEMLDKGTVKELQLAMQKDLRAAVKASRGKKLFFVAAADVPLADKTKKLTLFVVTPKEAVAKTWEVRLKGKKPRVTAFGTCTLESKDGRSVRVALDKVKGDRKGALVTARLAFKLDPTVKVADALAKDETENERAESETDDVQSGGAATEHLAALGLDPNDEDEIATLARELGAPPEKVKEMLSLHAAEIEAQAKKLLAAAEQE